MTQDQPPLPRVLTETTMDPAAVAELLNTSSKTAVRWMAVGLPVAGMVIKLEGVRVGTRWKTSREAVARFLNATTTTTAEPPPPPVAARKMSAETVAGLRRHGIKV